ncbi:16S rRNA (cytidine(1402)-2'-O)-methyltransferase [Desulfolucanica intricata]|uniref:16S rRNA (cytidine(1402)-2'-O)-methyltransferase n=1 Tax=Desulfolucanica intricata TaxID=1285191 RepID=UPI00082E4E3B|nr:16S rRNA (cytidine(1402)-2'-O)-methyltransferase [Desulfolucanica intricata]
MKKNIGKLYLCATPIGNLEDITLRVLRVLKEVDLIAAEDTRNTRKLLSHYDIHTPLTSYHRHNQQDKGMILINKLLEGQQIALVSDAGLPGISDPGEDLVKLALEKEIEVIPLPGPSAAVTALVVSGLPTRSFIFEGFLPASKKARRKKLKEIKNQTKTLVFYEAPHRITEMLEDVLLCLGNRKVSLSRELTKKFEETLRGTVQDILEQIKTNRPRGEFSIVIEGAKPEEIETLTAPWEKMTLIEHVKYLEKQNCETKEAIKKVAKIRGIPKREVYNAVLETKN